MHRYLGKSCVGSSESDLSGKLPYGAAYNLPYMHVTDWQCMDLAKILSSWSRRQMRRNEEPDQFSSLFDPSDIDFLLRSRPLRRQCLITCLTTRRLAKPYGIGPDRPASGL